MPDHVKCALLCLGLLLGACGGEPRQATPAPSTPTPTPTGRTLVFGDIDANDPARKYEWIKPFAEHVASELAAFGIGSGDVRIARDMPTMVSWLAAGEVDAYLDSLYPAMIVCERTGARPILRRWKGGVSEYHTVFITRAGSGIRALEDLPGQMLAFDDEASTSGFFLPVSYLRSRGFRLERYGSAQAAPSAGSIGYVFTGDDENTVQWLLSDRVAAAAIDNLTFEDDISPETREQLVVLAETEPVPRQVIVVRRDLEPELIDELTAVLLRLHETPGGRAALASTDTTRIDRFPEGAEVAIERFRKAYSAVREWIEP